MHAISTELENDRVNDDVTVGLLTDKNNIPTIAKIRAKEAGIFSGIHVVHALTDLFQGRGKIECLVIEGQKLEKGDEIVKIEGAAGFCLSIERTLINYLSHLSGVATLTRQFVDAVKPHSVEILATRKTLPGLRDLQLQAVVAGGGRVHRRNLSDGILIKENHQMFEDVIKLIEKSKQNRSPLHRVEVEIQDFETLERVIENPPDVIMLDNFSEGELAVAIKKIRTGLKSSDCSIEVSGGVTLETVKKIASLGVDFISVGRITHSSSSLNMSLDIQKL